jgi:hypothetical protein
MREFNSRELDSLDFDEVLARLQRGVDGLTLEKTASIPEADPEADVLCCRYKGKRFNVKFDLDYGVWIEAIDGLLDNEFKEVVVLLK